MSMDDPNNLLQFAAIKNDTQTGELALSKGANVNAKFENNFLDDDNFKEIKEIT